jgi:hypothetical protein
MREASRKHYTAHRDEIAVRAKARRAARRAAGAPKKQKRGLGTGACAACGEADVLIVFNGLGYVRMGDPKRVKHMLCEKCYGDKRRRAAGIPKVVTRTAEERRAYAARKAMEYHKARRAEAIAAYGGHCACCGESHPAFLTIDHIAGGGNAHRRSLTATGAIAGSSNFYAWLKKNKFPAGFQLLCHNCNFAKSHGGCPHREGGGSSAS